MYRIIDMSMRVYQDHILILIPLTTVSEKHL